MSNRSFEKLPIIIVNVREVCLYQRVLKTQDLRGNEEKLEIICYYLSCKLCMITHRIVLLYYYHDHNHPLYIPGKHVDYYLMYYYVYFRVIFSNTFDKNQYSLECVQTYISCTQICVRVYVCMYSAPAYVYCELIVLPPENASLLLGNRCALCVRVHRCFVVIVCHYLKREPLRIFNVLKSNRTTHAEPQDRAVYAATPASSPPSATRYYSVSTRILFNIIKTRMHYI